jgi:predicted nuclease with TOPRIM domain
LYFDPQSHIPSKLKSELDAETKERKELQKVNAELELKLTASVNRTSALENEKSALEAAIVNVTKPQSL